MIVVLLGLLSLTACNDPPESSNEEIVSFFEDNVSELEKLVEFCVHNPDVRWMGSEVGQIDVVTLIPENPDISTRNEAWGIIDRLGLRSIACLRDWRAEGRDLIAVGFSIWAVGLAVSGRSKGLEFAFEETPNIKSSVTSGEYMALDKEGWYLYSSSD
ncbi:MAG: hypothetical protein OXS28_08650 [Gammaproteobacteria bacterium]|nr:hypothetical protein [Gammaproteobacteria bacterium]MDE0283559.1 hypothetical protein [Gammaproteobacteria bacterium]